MIMSVYLTRPFLIIGDDQEINVRLQVIQDYDQPLVNKTGRLDNDLDCKLLYSGLALTITPVSCSVFFSIRIYSSSNFTVRKLFHRIGWVYFFTYIVIFLFDSPQAVSIVAQRHSILLVVRRPALH
mmetsp:Transcript_14770/g.19378  ORF Transcript_14770/g.19378 Transcript_14770/m.19378 type:complete len:126 (-) Transcript_14770:61-438(-)